MRYGVLADVHGNLPALTRAVEVLERDRVDAWLCAGDLVGYGPSPNECVALVRELGAACVAGNHDLIALGRLADDRCIRLARDSLRWTRAVLADEACDWLGELPLRLALPGGLVVAHGSLEDPSAYVTGCTEARGELDRLGALHPGSDLLLVGHTHLPLACQSGGRPHEMPGEGWLPLAPAVAHLLNPGSVGQSRERSARARCMLLDVEARRARWYALPYDIRACRRELRRHGLRADSCHLRPGLAGRAERALGRLSRARPVQPGGETSSPAADRSPRARGAR
jgi:predicted phosphodiesterase